MVFVRALRHIKTAKLCPTFQHNLILNRGFTTSQVYLSDKLFVHRDTEKNNPSIPFKFTEDNMKEVKSIIAKYPEQYKKGAVIPLLHVGQKQHGFTSISVMNEVARLLEMPQMRVYEVATFYTMFNRDPVGRYFIQVCTTTPCQLCGSDKIVKTLEEALGIKVGETTKDKKFTLVEVECAGACVNAPVLAVNDDYYEDLTTDETLKLLDDLKKDVLPKPGPMRGLRKASEPYQGLTSLKGPPPGPGFKVRSDL